MINISIRYAKLNELSRITFITKFAYKIPYKANSLITKSCEPKNIKDKFLNKEFFVVVAVFNNKIVGAVRYKIIEKNNLYFYKLAVLKIYRNKNIGSSLISKIDIIAKKKNCVKISLDCAQEKKLHGYYKKFGYKIDKIKKHLDHHDVYMSKQIK